MNSEKSREELADAVKPHAHGDPLDTCLRCDSDIEGFEAFNITWQTKGNAMSGVSPSILGYLCRSCVGELLVDWVYDLDPPQEDTS